MTTRERFKTKLVAGAVCSALIALAASRGNVSAQSDNGCSGLPSQADLKSALAGARGVANGGFNLDMWGSIVNRDGIVSAVAFTGAARGSQWPGSRVISAQKANTGGSLFGLQESNPVATDAAYQGPSSKFGTAGDPLVGQKVGGINVFGGGLALYNATGLLVGGIGVSGDTSCADHNIAWRTRHTLNLDFVPAGVGAQKDNINYQGLVPVPSLANDFSHPICKIAGVDHVSAISAALPPTQ